jgi:hypothetical protein
MARTETGDVAIPRVVVSDPAQVALQTIKDLFALWQGSWFLDQSVGFPWAQAVLGIKNPNVSQIQALIQQALLSVTGVVTVVAQVVFNRIQRAFGYAFAATLNTGAIITGGTNQAFQVSAGPGG